METLLRHRPPMGCNPGRPDHRSADVPGEDGARAATGRGLLPPAEHSLPHCEPHQPVRSEAGSTSSVQVQPRASSYDLAGADAALPYCVAPLQPGCPVLEVETSSGYVPDLTHVRDWVLEQAGRQLPLSPRG
jgi:hypothetical protein